jgi:hypothetical protein
MYFFTAVPPIIEQRCQALLGLNLAYMVLAQLR